MSADGRPQDPAAIARASGYQWITPDAVAKALRGDDGPGETAALFERYILLVLAGQKPPPDLCLALRSLLF